MSNKDNENIFIGGNLDGDTAVEETPANKQTLKRPKLNAPNLPEKRVTLTPGRNAMADWLAAPTVDPKAVVTCADFFGRKVEFHTDLSWEASVNLNVERRFVAGQHLRIVGGWAASTLTIEAPVPGLKTYIVENNSPNMLAVYAEYINTAGKVVPPNTMPSLFGMEVKVASTPYHTVTIGLLVHYEVQVVSPPAMAGLRLLLKPQQLVDDAGIDGNGNAIAAFNVIS